MLASRRLVSRRLDYIKMAHPFEVQYYKFTTLLLSYQMNSENVSSSFDESSKSSRLFGSSADD